MPVPATTDDFLQLARQSGLLEEKDLDAYLSTRGAALPQTPSELAATMVRDGLLTGFQADQFLKGKWRGFLIAGKYKLLEHLGSGGMANVFLCEHVSMHRRVALKLLPAAQAKDSGAVERFYREARAVATLDHPNIVRAHDIDHDGKVHFLVMEHVDGSSLQDIVRKSGPLPIERAAHYIRQTIVGLDAAYHAGVVHRDIKPGNILVDRAGTVKILDMGLARFFHDEGDDITKKFDENCVLGTADYCAPEQALNSHAVDARVDIYSLGATFYYLLTGRTPFGQGTTAQKIIWHQMKEPAPIRTVRPDVPEELAAVIAKMMAKLPDERYQTPAEVYDALTPWAGAEVPPPTEEELPKLCLRSKGPGSGDSSRVRRPAPPTAVQPRSAVSRATSAAMEPTVITPRPSHRSAKTPLVAGTDIDTRDAEPQMSARPPWLLPAAIGGGAVVLVVLLAVGLWWAFSDRPGAAVAIVPPIDSSRGDDTGLPALPPKATSQGPPSQTDAAVAINADEGGFRVRAPNYEAVIEKDGNLASLKVRGLEFFKPNVKFGNQLSRGAYIYSEAGQGVLSLPTVERSGNVITARGELAAVSHAFHDSSVHWTVQNLSDSEERFYIVFDKQVRAVTDGAGHWSEAPAPVPAGAPTNFQVGYNWPTTSWFAGHSRLTLDHGTRIWGQWPTIEENYQVWELRIGPRETRAAGATFGEATAEELRQVAEVTGTAPPAPPVASVSIKAEKGGRRILAPKYEALVENDGCLTSLKIGGVELLWPGLSFSRGSYFHQLEKEGALPMAHVEQPADNVVTAKGEWSAARYEFGNDSLTWTLSNNTNERMNFFVVFTPAVKSVTNGAETVGTPTVKDWKTTTWDFGKTARLKVSGGTRIWGPWPTPMDKSQVLHADLDPHETRRLTLQILDGAEPATGMTLHEPRDYQVFQRRTRLDGSVAVRGATSAACDAVEARLSGPSLAGPLADRWEPLTLAADRRGFSATLPARAGGWYRLDVRALSGGKQVAVGAVEHVGVGEVFVIAGQSNSTNSGEERLKTASRLVASFGGGHWQPADDPQPGVSDSSSGGSPWPPFGDALAEKYKVPVGIASVGKGGSSAAEWKPNGDLFQGMTKRMEALGPHGFRAVLWHQGEADSSTSADDYARRLTETIQASRKAAGWDVPWFVAQVSYNSPGAAKAESTRAGQKRLWETKVALEGPDTDALGVEYRDGGGQGVHFSAKGLRAHGKLWADKVGAYLDKALAE